MPPIKLSELAPPPERGRVFEQALLPGLADAAPSGRVRLDSIARWLQDIAFADVVETGLDDRGTWVVRRLRIRVESFPRFGEPLEARTFCSAMGSLVAERRTTIGGERSREPGAGDPARVEAAALWVHLDASSGRPTRLPPELRAVYGESAGERRARRRLRHPAPPAEAKRSSWAFRSVDLDVADHVNNSAYWEPVEARLLGSADPDGASEPDTVDLEIEHREPADAGEATVLEADGMLWITAPDETVCASIAGWAPPHVH
jgi:acyl-ACP thioesterase